MSVFRNWMYSEIFSWDSTGLLVSAHPAMTWLTEWDMTIDQEDHAILTFQDIRNTEIMMFLLTGFHPMVIFYGEKMVLKCLPVLHLMFHQK